MPDITDVPIIASRPAEVIDLRRELYEFWSRKGRVQYAMTRQGRRSMPGHVGEAVEDERARSWMENVLRTATMYWVSPDMVEVLAAMAPTVPDSLALPPVPEAFVVFAKPIPGMDATTGVTIYTAAYLWGPVTVVSIPALTMQTFGWRSTMHPPDLDTTADEELWRSLMPTKLVLTGGSEWPDESQTSDFSILPADSQTMQESILEDRRLMSAFWALCSQRISVESFDHGDRAARRRSNRTGIMTGSVRVINLREPVRKRKSEDGESPVDWSHRWMVGWPHGYWKNQPYGPRSSLRRPQLVLPFVKGPENKPLVIRETVRALKR